MKATFYSENYKPLLIYKSANEKPQPPMSYCVDDVSGSIIYSPHEVQCHKQGFCTCRLKKKEDK
jgi:hypothetical protein